MKLRERLARILHGAAHWATQAATTLDPVADDANVRNAVGIAERVKAYGYDANVVWWSGGGGGQPVENTTYVWTPGGLTQPWHS